MDNDDNDVQAPSETKHTSARGRRSGSSNRGAIAVAVVMFLLGGVIGLLGGLLLGEDGSDGADGSAAPSSDVSIDCAQAEAVVEAAVAEMSAINETEVQDASFFAALLVQQRGITFAMDAAPTCFDLGDRAAAHGLLDGIAGLMQNSATLQAGPLEAVPGDEGE